MRMIIILVFLAGCQGMTNDEIIAETKKCEGAGLDAHLWMNGINQRWIQCHPKKSESE